MVRFWLVIVMLLSLQGCDDKGTLAPITDLTSLPRRPLPAIQPTSYKPAHQQAKSIGKTLLSISTLSAPLSSPPGKQGAADGTSFGLIAIDEHWLWPAEGILYKKFSNQNKGIDIKGKKGTPIYASLAGQVIYSGKGLARYAHLIIIKHDLAYLSAYAYTRTPLVKEGDWVNRGQKIANMGLNNTGEPVLHFEIRRAGLALDPLPLLSNKKRI